MMNPMTVPLINGSRMLAMGGGEEPKLSEKEKEIIREFAFFFFSAIYIILIKTLAEISRASTFFFVLFSLIAIAFNYLFIIKYKVRERGE